MKLTHTQNMKATKPGLTLLELTVVILVLLSLISILFIGARAWKKGSDRAASILQIRNVQQAVRSFSNLNQADIGDAVNTTETVEGDIFGPGNFIENSPVGNHPAGNDYDYALLAVVPPVGTLFMTTTGTGTNAGDELPAFYDPAENSHDDW